MISIVDDVACIVVKGNDPLAALVQVLHFGRDIPHSEFSQQ